MKKYEILDYTQKDDTLKVLEDKLIRRHLEMYLNSGKIADDGWGWMQPGGRFINHSQREKLNSQDPQLQATVIFIGQEAYGSIIRIEKSCFYRGE